MPEPGTLDGGVPSPLLLIEPTEQEVHLLVDFLVRMGFLAKAVGALAVMDFLLRHGLTLRDGPMDSTTSLPKKRGTCSWMAPKLKVTQWQSIHGPFDLLGVAIQNNG